MTSRRPDDLAPLGPPGPPEGEAPRNEPARPRSLRQRLLLALVGISAGSVLLAGLITVAFARPAVRSLVAAELQEALTGLPEAELKGELPRLNRLRRFLGADGIGLVMVQPNSQVTRPLKGRLGARFPGAPFDRGNLVLDPLRDASKEADPGGLPRGVDAGDLDTNSLLEGQVQTGGRGDLVFVAQPLAPRALGVPVVVVSERIGLFPFGRLGTLLLVAAAVAAAAAAGVSVWLVRRLTRPLAAMERTARAIAAGDLRARVEGMAGAEDELAALGEAIDTMAAELERARGLERAFLMSVSHDLRTPLTSIRGYAEAVAEGTVDDDESRKRAAAIIGAEARRLERLVADLLDLARLDAREFSLHPRLVDVAEVVATAVEALQPAAREAGLRLAAAPGGPVPAEVDPERVGQVVANLVENALKYATTAIDVEVLPPGVRGVPAGPGVRRPPALGVPAGPGWGPAVVQISVTDDGPGIDPQDISRVFERLYTSRQHTGRKVGTGLGLAIVRELVGAMGGTVEISRTPGGRTRFLVSLVGSPDGSSRGSSAASSSRSGGDGSTTSRRTPVGPSWSSRPDRGTPGG